MGTGALIVSIIGVVFGFISPLIGIVLGVVGLILGFKAKGEKDKLATPSIVLSIVAIIISIVIFVLALMVSSKSVTRTIDNARKDTFRAVAESYVQAARNANIADEITCSENASESGEFKTARELGVGDYYIFLSTDENAITLNFSEFPKDLASQVEKQTVELLNIGGKSSWQNVDVYGWIHFKNDSSNRTEFYIALTDVSGHGIANEVKILSSTRNDVVLKDAKADVIGTLNTINKNSQTYYCHYKQK